MIKLYSVTEAERSILRRGVTLTPEVPPALQARLDDLFGKGATPATAVTTILHDVQQRGDAALSDWTAKIDRVSVDRWPVEKEHIETAVARVPADLADALQFAADRIRQFHSLDRKSVV